MQETPVKVEKPRPRTVHVTDMTVPAFLFISNLGTDMTDERLRTLCEASFASLDMT